MSDKYVVETASNGGTFFLDPENIAVGPKNNSSNEKIAVTSDHTSSSPDKYAVCPPSIKGLPSSGEVRVGPDGTVLVPQPSSSPDDPLNWTWKKKHLVMLALIPGCMLSDWALTWGSTVFEKQAMDWNMSPKEVSQSMSPAIFMQGPGGLLAVPLCQRYGRLPVLFWSQFLTLIVTIGCTVAPDYVSFTACRALQGFLGAAPQVIGMSMIHDMFFFHERARKINLWAASFLIGPYLGPFFSTLIILKLEWRPDFAVLCGFYALSTIMVVLFGDETLFHRNAPEQKPKTWTRHLSLLIGIEGVRASGRPDMWTVTKHLSSLLARPHLFFPTAFFVMPITMWTIGIVSTITQFTLPIFNFNYVSLAMLYWAPMIGTLVGEVWGRYFNDWIVSRYTKRHDGKHAPENRLNGVYIPVVFGVAGLVLFGETLQHSLHWIGIAFGWAMLCFATLGAMTAISAYVLDCFPNHASLAAAWINFWRVIGGFSVAYFQMDWVHLSGYSVTFGSQAAIIAAASLSVIATQIWGKGWRNTWPAPPAEN
ncbi:major facilitator superfamily domain-containing protein [Phyllosticta citrichinensis]|uniref:Major facilitator superfamily domain-containing protein n=1 Tax=Phyllosticta citrichinensis TaxID=1130410 RepID=A0ABR1XYK4_9PEZI